MNIAQHIPTTFVDLISPDHPLLGLGMDVATTTSKKSNPSALCLTQKVGIQFAARLLISWKSRDPEVAEAIIRYVVSKIPHGFKVKKLCIDATSERFFAVTLKRKLASVVSCKLVISSNTLVYKGESMTVKSYLGNLAVNAVEDGLVLLPNEPWVKTDFRLVLRDRGSFVTEVDEEGRHGDCFDAFKLSMDAIVTKGGDLVATGAPVGAYQSAGKPFDRFPMRAPAEPDRPKPRLL
ncbi:MAG: hypothetical protein R6X19_08540 [Kiritimatiellia bacterium]